jgi:hypothetical protein
MEIGYRKAIGWHPTKEQRYSRHPLHSEENQVADWGSYDFSLHICAGSRTCNFYGHWGEEQKAEAAECATGH